MFERLTNRDLSERSFCASDVALQVLSGKVFSGDVLRRWLRMPQIWLPRLRIFPRPDGTLRFHHREGALEPVDNNWWIDVLYDPRARTPIERDIPKFSHNAHYRIDRQPGDTIQAKCECGHVCPLLDKAKLLGEFGADINAVWIVRELSGCRNRNKLANMCRALPIRC